MIQRTAETTLHRLAKGFSVVCVTGPLQSGKTTLAKRHFPRNPLFLLKTPISHVLRARIPEVFSMGKVASVFSYVIEKYSLIISSYSISECETAFDKKFPTKKEYLKIFFDSFDFELFETPKKIRQEKYPQIGDSQDLPILVSAILADADILLNGDKDFCDIKMAKPLIFTPNHYFDLIDIF